MLLVPAAASGGSGALPATEADALVLDLEVDAPPAAVEACRELLRAAHLLDQRPLLYVRVGTIELTGIDELLAALVPEVPDGILLGRCEGGHDVQHLAVKLRVHEAANDLVDGEIAVIAEVGATARSVFALDSFRDCSSRLLALSWNPAGLWDDLGFDGTDAAGEPSPLRTARDLVLLAARAAEVTAIDRSGTGLDGEVFRHGCARARRDGFNAQLVVTAEQVAVVNAVYDRSG